MTFVLLGLLSFVSINIAEAAPPSQAAARRLLAQALRSSGMAQAKKVRDMSLEQTLKEMLQRNPTLAREKLTIQKSNADLLSARGAFAFDIQLDLRLNGSNLPADSIVDPQLLTFVEGDLSLQSFSVQGTILLTKRFEIGTLFTVQFTNFWSMQDSINFSFAGGNQGNSTISLQRVTGGLTLTVSQPLLKGAWLPFNLSPIYQAVAQVKVTKSQVAVSASKQVLDTVQAYWDLVYAKKNVSIQNAALKLANKQLTQTLALIQAGKMASLEQYQVKQVIAARKGDLLLAKEQELAAETKLRILLNWDPGMVIQPQEGNENIPNLPAFRDLLRSIDSNHPQIRIAKQQKVIAKWRVVSAKNQVLPQLDLNGSFTFAGSGRTFPPRNGQPDPNAQSPLGRTYETLFDPRFNRFFVGITLKIPIDNRAARGRLNASNVELQRSQMQLMLLKRQYMLQAAQLFTQAQRNKKRLEITKDSLLWAQKKLEAEANKLAVGQSTLFQVLQFQQDLAKAKLARLRAYVDLHKTLASLHHTSGTILEKYNVVSFKP